ncbi:MAG TPA: hypothetical protein VFT64_08430 [Rickettsiales bacterium]|nr:hypothetical protein [Rickettsiales bacterium]
MPLPSDYSIEIVTDPEKLTPAMHAAYQAGNPSRLGDESLPAFKEYLANEDVPGAKEAWAVVRDNATGNIVGTANFSMHATGEGDNAKGAANILYPLSVVPEYRDTADGRIDPAAMQRIEGEVFDRIAQATADHVKQTAGTAAEPVVTTYLPHENPLSKTPQEYLSDSIGRGDDSKGIGVGLTEHASVYGKLGFGKLGVDYVEPPIEAGDDPVKYDMLVKQTQGGKALPTTGVNPQDFKDFYNKSSELSFAGTQVGDPVLSDMNTSLAAVGDRNIPVHSMGIYDKVAQTVNLDSVTRLDSEGHTGPLSERFPVEAAMIRATQGGVGAAEAANLARTQETPFRAEGAEGPGAPGTSSAVRPAQTDVPGRP